MYKGSLTFPPCDNTVNWYIYENPIKIKQTQLDQLNKLFKLNFNFAAGNGNNRNIQSLGGRTVTKGNVNCEEQFIYFFSFFVIYIILNYFIFKSF